MHVACVDTIALFTSHQEIFARKEARHALSALQAGVRELLSSLNFTAHLESIFFILSFSRAKSLYPNVSSVLNTGVWRVIAFVFYSTPFFLQQDPVVS
jgi:hypothetical protein